jgi:hypothetical protein
VLRGLESFGRPKYPRNLSETPPLLWLNFIEKTILVQLLHFEVTFREDSKLI